MYPTLKEGDLIFITQVLYNPDRHDIVVYQDPNGYKVIKRVIALPGETVEIKDGIIFVNGKALSEDYTFGVSNDYPLTQVPDNAYFLVGDNRTPGESYDSRSEKVGFIDKEQIVGELLFHF